MPELQFAAAWLDGISFETIRDYSDAEEIKPGRGWTIPVVGESHFQAEIERQSRKHGGTEHDIKVTAVLSLDDGNTFDANAVKAQVGGQPVGYLPSEAVQQYRAAIGTVDAQCSAKIVGGFALKDGSSAMFGVKLNPSWPPNSNNVSRVVNSGPASRGWRLTTPEHQGQSRPMPSY